MFKEFARATLSLKTVDPFTEKKGSITLRDLTEDADTETIVSVRDALQNVIDNSIVMTEVTNTYTIA
ncbi:hypothetical protein HZY88_01265 [Aerococcaceae bacterium DSM 111176]|nr:hypothetical protein [Aerococcaceae bacterium DSM 111176]